MRTLLAVVSIGSRSHLTTMSMPRIMLYAERHGYNVALVTNPIQPEGKPPHYAKLRVPHLFPGFDRYCVIDDDLLVDPSAPPLPDVPPGYVGLVRDHEQRHTKDPDVEWTGNTGFLIFDQSAVPLLDAACDHGDEPTIWGFADQGALNYVIWKHKRAFELDRRWNFAPVLHYFLEKPGIGWEKWSTSRWARIYYFSNMILNPYFVGRESMQKQWGIHLIRTQYNWIFDRIAPSR